MSEPIAGIHHVTAIATDPQRNLDFYAGVLGLRLVKRTVNFDDPQTYHFYFGDTLGSPGTILTFFPWPAARRGRPGAGQVAVTSFSIPAGALGFWQERLRRHGVVAEAPKVRFDDEVLAFADPDGLRLELVSEPEGAAVGPLGESRAVAPEHAIRGLHSVALAVREPAATAELLTSTMGLQAGGERGDRLRLAATAGGLGSRVDLLATPDTGFGAIAAGSVHHVAWRVPDEGSQVVWRQRIANTGLRPTEVLDRQYFKSIYFREPGGVLFEFATDPPGFTRDEEPAELGAALKLPPWLESRREDIEKALPAIDLPEVGA